MSVDASSLTRSMIRAADRSRISTQHLVAPFIKSQQRMLRMCEGIRLGFGDAVIPVGELPEPVTKQAIESGHSEMTLADVLDYIEATTAEEQWQVLSELGPTMKGKLLTGRRAKWDDLVAMYIDNIGEWTMQKTCNMYRQRYSQREKPTVPTLKAALNYRKNRDGSKQNH